MDYEILYEDLQSTEKILKDKNLLFQKNLKNVDRNMEKGDLKTSLKDLEQMKSLIEAQQNLIEELKLKIESFDQQEYFENGDLAEQMLSYFKEFGIDIKGVFPTYEIFPYKIKIDAQNLEMLVDKKRISCIRPKVFVKDVKASLDRLLKVNFNAAAFSNELSNAYDLALVKRNSQSQVELKEADLLLKDLYQYLAPMQRFRKDYDMQSFAFDIARLYAAPKEPIKDGRLYSFGPGKQESKVLRILDGNGREQFIATIRYFNVGE